MKIKPFIGLLIFVSGTLMSCNPPQSKKIEHADDLIAQFQQKMEAEEFSDARQIIDQVVTLERAINDTLRLINALYLATQSSVLSDKFKDAIQLGQEGTTLSKSLADLESEYRFSNFLAWAYYETNQDFNESLKLEERQVYLAEQIGKDEYKARAYNNYGYDATVAGTIPLTQAIKYAKFANDYYAVKEGHQGLWYTLMNLGWQHRLINELAQAEVYGRLSVAQAETDNDRHAIIEANTNLGETLLMQGKTEEASPLYERGRELSKEKDDRDKYVFDVYYSRYLWQTDQKEEAILTLISAIDFLETSEIFYEMLARAFLADYAFSTGNTELAKKQLAKFKNPRADYYSQEAKVIASMVEAKLMSESDRQKARESLDSTLRELEISGAETLRTQLQQLRDLL